MNEQERRKTDEKSPISYDIFLGILSMGIFSGVGIGSGIFNWLGLYIIGAVASSVLVVLEILRYRVPLPHRYQSARNVAMIMASIALVGNLLYLFARGVFKLY